MYTEGAKGSCRDTAQGLLVAIDTGSAVLSHAYLPWYMPDAVQLGQDTIALSSSFYTTCSVDKLMTTLTHLPTLEGGSSFLGRVVSSMNYEISDWMAEDANPFATDSDRGCALGKAIQAVFKWHI